MPPTHLAVSRGHLTLDDLEQLAFRYGGTVERTRTGWQLVGAVIDGRVIPSLRVIA